MTTHKHVQNHELQLFTCHIRKCCKLNVSFKFVENSVRLSTTTTKNQTSISVSAKMFFDSCRNVHFSIKIYEKSDDSCLHSMFCNFHSNFCSTNYEEGQIIEGNWLDSNRTISETKSLLVCCFIRRGAYNYYYYYYWWINRTVMPSCLQSQQ